MKKLIFAFILLLTIINIVIITNFEQLIWVKDILLTVCWILAVLFVSIKENK
jgi:hypothetical protein